MRRFLSTSFIALALLITAAGAAPAAHAGDIPAGGDCTSNPSGCVSGTTCVDIGTGEASFCQPPGGGGGGTAVDKAVAAAAATPTTLPQNPVNSEGFGTIMTWIMGLFAWLVGVAALTLNYAVYYTVVTMGDYVHQLSAVGVTWRILRDIGNILFIFGFLGIGISLILDVGWYGGKTKMLPMLLIGAIFLNFSLFITEAVIDVGNLFATQFYTQINGGTLPTQASLVATTAASEGISNKIMAQLGLQTIYNPNSNQNVLKGGNTWLIGFMGIILFLITAFVMFSLAFILIARFIILLFLIILAPIGFAGLAIPQLKSTADKWWHTLFQQTITAPVLLLLLYIALAVITDTNFLTFGSSGGKLNWTGFVDGSNLTGFASLILSFLVAMGLLFAVVIIAKQLSAFGADGATKLAGKLSFGATAWAGRSTVGWGSQRLLDRFQKSSLARKAVVGRAISATLGFGAKGSFDARGVKAFGGLKATGVEAGEAQKGGYQAWEKEKIKGREEYAKTLKQTPEEKSQQEAGERRKVTLDKELEKKKRDNKEREEDLKNDHKSELEPLNSKVAEAEQKLKKLNDNVAGGGTVSDAELKEAKDSLEEARTLRKAKTDEQKDALKKLQKINQEEIEVKEKEIEDQQKMVENLKGAPKLAYATSISSGLGSFFNRNKVAAENIKKEAKKSKTDQDLDSLKKLIEENKPKEDKKEEAKPAAIAH